MLFQWARPFRHMCEETVIHPQIGIQIQLAFIANDSALHRVSTKSTVRLHLALICTITQTLLIVLVQKVPAQNYVLVYTVQMIYD